MKCTTLACLKKQKVKLLKLKAMRDKEKQLRDERLKLEKEVKQLKKDTKQKLIKEDGKLGRLIKTAKSDEAKKQLRRARKHAKLGWNAFQRFARKYGD